MAYKPRTEPKKLTILRVLNSKMTLLKTDRQHYYSLQKGYEGEVMFDKMTERLQCECYIINDLRLKVNNTTFQIDTLIIVAGKIHFYEVKNYEGDYFIDPETGLLYKLPKSEYLNPLNQVIRSESLLRQLLQNLRVNIPVEGHAVFINPEFTLYQAPLDKPIIFPTQVNSYLKTLDKTPSKLYANHKKLADKLVSLHLEESPYTELPQYKYGQLKKRMICEKCQSSKITVFGKKCVCGNCGHDEPVADAVLRSVEELRLLFPDMKITTNIVHDWCGVVDSKKRISRILDKNYKITGVGQWAYYK